MEHLYACIVTGMLASKGRPTVRLAHHNQRLAAGRPGDRTPLAAAPRPQCNVAMSAPTGTRSPVQREPAVTWPPGARPEATRIHPRTRPTWKGSRAALNREGYDCVLWRYNQPAHDARTVTP